MSSGATAEPAASGVPLAARREPSTAAGTTIVIGLGNPLLGDDGVGWRVAEAVERRLGRPGRPSDVEVDRLSVGGLALMERLVGHRRAILVDAIVGAGGRPGEVSCRPLEAVETRTASHLDSAHDAPLGVALAAGRALGAALPEVVDVVGIVAERADTFDEVLSDAVRDAVPVAVDAVMALLERRA